MDSQEEEGGEMTLQKVIFFVFDLAVWLGKVTIFVLLLPFSLLIFLIPGDRAR